MQDWLSNLDPNLLIGAATAVLTFLKLRKDGEKTVSITDALKSALRMKMLWLLAQAVDTTEQERRAVLDSAAAELLARFGVKRSKSVDVIVRAAIEAVMVELEERLLALRTAQIQAALNAAHAGTQEVREAFDAAKTSPFPKLDLPFEEIREPSSTVEQVYGNDPSEPALPGLDAEAAAAKVRSAIAKNKDP